MALGERVYPMSFRFLAWPGIFPAYYFGTITNSLAVGWTAFVLGMVGCYGGTGLVLDLFFEFRWAPKTRR
jgi:hypothetical protein